MHASKAPPGRGPGITFWRGLTALWFAVAVVLTAGSTWLWWAHGVPFARPPHPWNAATVHIAGPWVIWAVSGWLARR